MTKSFIDEVPREIEQAAEILGASRWRHLRHRAPADPLRLGCHLPVHSHSGGRCLLAIITKTQVTTLPIELSKYQGTTEGRVGRQAALAIGITIPLMIVGLIIRKHLARGFSSAWYGDSRGAHRARAWARRSAAARSCGLSQAIADGEFVLYWSRPSGTGKTTTLRMIAGFIDASAGEIRIDGRVVNDLEPRDRGLGMVFQTHALFPHKTVMQNVEFGLRVKGMPAREQAQRVHEVARWCASRTCSTRCPVNAPAARRSAWRWRAR